MTEGKDTRAAFPHNRDACGTQLGMTLRDYFASKAMAGQLSAQDESGFGIWSDFENLAKAAYAIADAMLKERNKA